MLFRPFKFVISLVTSMKLLGYLEICVLVSLMLFVTTMIEAQTTASSRNDKNVTMTDVEVDLQQIMDCASNTKTLGKVLTQLEDINTLFILFSPEAVRLQYIQMLDWFATNIVTALQMISEISFRLRWLTMIIQ